LNNSDSYKKKFIKDKYEKNVYSKNENHTFSLRNLLLYLKIIIIKERMSLEILDIPTKISGLCRLFLFSYENDNFNNLNLKCHISLNYVIELSLELNIDIDKYLKKQIYISYEEEI